MKLKKKQDFWGQLWFPTRPCAGGFLIHSSSFFFCSSLKDWNSKKKITTPATETEVDNWILFQVRIFRNIIFYCRCAVVVVDLNFNYEITLEGRWKLLTNSYYLTVLLLLYYLSFMYNELISNTDHCLQAHISIVL